MASLVLELEARLDNLLATAQTETADIDLFAPIVVKEREECPICMIPLPIDEDLGCVFYACCGKMICNGCIHAQTMNDRKSRVPNHKKKCAFCCKISPKNDIKQLKKLMKRDNNPMAFCCMAALYKTGAGVLQTK